VSAIEQLIGELSKLPGIGRKTATRLTYHLLKQPAESVRRLAETVQTLAQRVRPCSVCGNLGETDPCPICDDPRRDQSTVCVVEEASDIGAIERTGEYRGLYHVLGGHLSPLDGVGPDDLRVEALHTRLANGTTVREVIVRVTRIALGLPVGGDLEYSDSVTIAQALAARREMAT
jgi:recombination protein RecR